MSDLFWLRDEQIERLRPFFPKSHGKPRGDDRRVLSGIVFANRNGLRWCDALSAYVPYKTRYNRWKRWGEAGVFTRMMEGLAAVGGEPKTVMSDATYLKPHRTASSLRLKRGSWPPDRAHQMPAPAKAGGGMNTKLHALADANGRPLSFFMTAGQVSDYTGAAAASKSCSAVSKTGGALPPATIAAPRLSSLPSPSLQPSSFGCDQRVLTLSPTSRHFRYR